MISFETVLATINHIAGMAKFCGWATLKVRDRLSGGLKPEPRLFFLEWRTNREYVLQIRSARARLMGDGVSLE